MFHSLDYGGFSLKMPIVEIFVLEYYGTLPLVDQEFSTIGLQSCMINILSRQSTKWSIQPYNSKPSGTKSNHCHWTKMKSIHQRSALNSFLCICDIGTFVAILAHVLLLHVWYDWSINKFEYVVDFLIQWLSRVKHQEISSCYICIRVLQQIYIVYSGQLTQQQCIPNKANISYLYKWSQQFRVSEPQPSIISSIPSHNAMP